MIVGEDVASGDVLGMASSPDGLAPFTLSNGGMPILKRTDCGFCGTTLESLGAGRMLGREAPMPLKQFSGTVMVNLVGSFNLIPVAVARDIRQAMPVAGSFVGMTDAFAGMTVEVAVTAI